MMSINLRSRQFAKTVVLSAATFKDQTAQISPSLWERAEPFFRRSIDELCAVSSNSSLRDDIERLSGDPYNAPLRAYLEEETHKLLRGHAELSRRLGANLLHAAEFGRLLPHHGSKANQLTLASSLEDQIDQLKSIPIQAPQSNKPEILVILPFRCSSQDRARLRNLLACIVTLSRQTIARDRFYLIAVEQDCQPSLREVISPLVDKYVFAENPGQFSIAWGRNVGVRQGPPCRAVCLLDTDMAVAPDFLRSCLVNLSGDVGGVLPFHRVLCLDARSSSSVVDRLAMGSSLPTLEYLRGHVMNEVYGFAMATTNHVYNEIGGQDERYRDWGDEDNEFYYQLRSVTEVRRLTTWIYHLDHMRPVMRHNGKRNNAEAIANPRQRGGDFGHTDKYNSLQQEVKSGGPA